MRIGLYGILGVYNFGCEAIVRGACQLIRRLYPEAQIVYFTYSYDYDKKALQDLNLEIRPIELKATFWDKVQHKIKVKLNSERCGFYFDFDSVIGSVDMIFSIGGDIYTIPKFLRAQNAYPYYNSLVEFCDRAIDAGKDVVVYGASVGPFGNYKKAIDYYKKNLSRYKMIICREEESVNYLNSLGLRNTCFFPDPAFQVKAVDRTPLQPKYIGINLSPLSLKEIYGKHSEETYVNYAKMIDSVFESTHKDILLIPHVISKDEMDDDESFLHKLKILTKPETQQHIHFADWKGGFLGLKPQLKECYLVISARMHCAINAIDENIPAIFLAYSQKSVGMCKYIYGNCDYLIDLKAIETELIKKVQIVFRNSDNLSAKLELRNKEIEQYYKDNLNNVKRILR
ncbi:polysaccharide pyruvyl transferase family protein [Faecalibacterium prausnitzii]|jgi:colanic acid/amylovoran biosynthesis protein|uniref:polysaccharide pyruvyl transferase family protein n=1 Tax=Faecalibacterium prausnitzii TaxID=853 RepID=UPI000E422D1C|nr:polysaccharide pyruvyl transferase family protein [Faecalibacterium prausnitzii]RGC40417.1 polysaccharide pyruvyl transferase family protein [Faecalibacterium prausnitzii]